MTTPIDVKVFEKRLDAELEKLQARMQQLEALAREKKAQAEIDALGQARNLVQQIGQKRSTLRGAVGMKAVEAQSDLEAASKRLESSLAHVASRLTEAHHHAPR